mgnify:FL=1
MTAIEYTIYERPQTSPVLENPTLENPTPGYPMTENPIQLNKDIQRTDLPKKEEKITDEQSTHSTPILSPAPSPLKQGAFCKTGRKFPAGKNPALSIPAQHKNNALFTTLNALFASKCRL